MTTQVDLVPLGPAMAGGDPSEPEILFHATFLQWPPDDAERFLVGFVVSLQGPGEWP